MKDKAQGRFLLRTI